MPQAERLREFGANLHLNRHPVVRGDFADANALGAGFVVRDTWSGGSAMDAPDFMPQGGWYQPNTMTPQAWALIGHRDWDSPGCMAPGTAHCGPYRAPCQVTGSTGPSGGTA